MMRSAALFALLLFAGRAVHAQLPLLVESNYDDAEITIDDKPTAMRTPGNISIDPGRHKITLTFNDIVNRCTYVAEDCVAVSAGHERIRIDFKPVSITMVRNAEHTKIFLSGRFKGEGVDLILKDIIPGTYALRLQQPYGLQVEKEVHFPPNSTETPPECFVFGNLFVASDGIGEAKVIINGIRTNRKSPAVFNNLIIGEYKVGLETIDGRVFTTPVIVRSGKDTRILINASASQEAKPIERQHQTESANSDRKIGFVEIKAGFNLNLDADQDFTDWSLGAALPINITPGLLAPALYFCPEIGVQKRDYSGAFKRTDYLSNLCLSLRAYPFAHSSAHVGVGISSHVRVSNKKIEISGEDYQLPRNDEYKFAEVGFDAAENLTIKMRYYNGSSDPGPDALKLGKRYRFFYLELGYRL